MVVSVALRAVPQAGSGGHGPQPLRLHHVGRSLHAFCDRKPLGGEAVGGAAQRQARVQQPFGLIGKTGTQGGIDRDPLEHIALGMAAADLVDARPSPFELMKGGVEIALVIGLEPGSGRGADDLGDRSHVIRSRIRRCAARGEAGNQRLGCTPALAAVER